MSHEEIISVSELTQKIKEQLEGRFRSLAVRGEISNCKEHSSGHYYFTLKDSQAQISALLFRSQAQKMRELPKNGEEVVVRGEINLYPPRGQYQLVVRSLESAGVGALLLQFDLLKRRLEALGWFDPSRKRPLPTTPRTIGVISSPTGAVIQDILQILSRRHKGFHLILNPVKVQGESAAREIAAAIDQFNHYQLAQVLIIARGGGSLEDLWPFNEEIVAAAIIRSQIPIISAVGHETDFSIADFVADLRAPTPSAAAELVMKATIDQQQQLQQLQQRIEQRLRQLICQQRQRLQLLCKHPMIATPYGAFILYSRRLDELADAISVAMERLLQERRQQLENCRHRWERSPPIIGPLREKLDRLLAHLQSVDPKNILQKGYAILFREKRGSIILSSKEIKSGDSLHILMKDGAVDAKVVEA